MKALKYMDDEAVIKKGMNALLTALGPVEAIRFIAMPKARRMESVSRHREWQKSLDKESFFDDVFAVKTSEQESNGLV